MLYDSKLIIIDIDFHKINTDNVDVFQNIKNLLQQISGDQNLIIITNENLTDAIDFITKLNLRSGYLISNSGAVIYDIGAQKTLFEMRIKPEEVHSICHVATLRDLIVIVNDRNGHKITYEINNSMQKILLNQNNLDYYKGLKIYNVWRNFIYNLSTLNINSIEIILPESKVGSINNSIKDFVHDIHKLVNLEIFKSKNNLFITPKFASRLNAISKVASMLKKRIETDALYVGVSSFQNRLIKYCYFSVTSREIYHQYKDLLTGKLPTIFFSNNQNAWISWLMNYDYLWANRPDNNELKHLTDQNTELDPKLMHDLNTNEWKTIQIYQNNNQQWNTQPINHKTSVFHKLWNKTDKNNQTTYNVKTILVWAENKKELIQKFDPKTKDKNKPK